MEIISPATLLHWFDYTAQLIPRVCVVAAAALLCIRWQWVRRALRGAETSWNHRLTMILAFGGLAILATHSGIIVNFGQGVDIGEWPTAGLAENQALVGFRDTMALAAGLVGGPWVGMGAGAMAGYERYLLGGFAGLGSGVGTFVLGLFAGWVRWRFYKGRMATTQGALVVALAGTLLHRLILLLFAKPYPLALLLTLDIVIPVAVVNCLGCVLFIGVMRDLDRDKLEAELRQARWRGQEAELRALRAQVEPHFLNNTLNAIRSLIRLDPDKARDYVVELANFFEATRKTACANTIPLGEELSQLRRYLDFQRLRFGGKFHYLPPDVPEACLDCHLPPRSLITLAENALSHGMRGAPDGFVLAVTVEESGESWILRMADNGCGIEPERLAKLGKKPVESPDSNGSGLYQLAKSLELCFQGRADLCLNSEPGRGTEVVMSLPKEI